MHQFLCRFQQTLMISVCSLRVKIKNTEIMMTIVPLKFSSEILPQNSKEFWKKRQMNFFLKRVYTLRFSSHTFNIDDRSRNLQILEKCLRKWFYVCHSGVLFSILSLTRANLNHLKSVVSFSIHYDTYPKLFWVTIAPFNSDRSIKFKLENL